MFVEAARGLGHAGGIVARCGRVVVLAGSFIWREPIVLHDDKTYVTAASQHTSVACQGVKKLWHGNGFSRGHRQVIINNSSAYCNGKNIVVLVKEQFQVCAFSNCDGYELSCPCNFSLLRLLIS
jgi:hypothetical protein